MARNGSGTYSLPAGNPVVTNTVISSTTHNNTMTDVGTALTNSVCRNGEAPFTADQPMGDNKITGLKNPTTRTDATNLAAIQDGKGVYGATVGGSGNVITVSLDPAITAYVAGQKFSFIAGAANTGAVTVNFNTVGAKAVTKVGSTALVANDILSGSLVEVEYDGTRFQLISPIGTGAIGDAKTANPLSQFATTTSAQLAGVISNETGTGLLVFGTGPAIATPDIDGGTIDNTTIGASTPAAATTTTLNTTGAVVFNDAGADVDFRVEGDTDANLLVVDASADAVGIGIAAPTYKLDVAGAVTATPVTNGIVRIQTTGSNPATGNGGGLLFSQQNSVGSMIDYASITGSRVDQSANNKVDMVFATGDPTGSVAVAERMRITTAGNIGIGCTPINNLQVHSPTSASGQVQITNNSTGATTGDGVIIGFDGSNQAIFNNKENTPMIFATSATERMRIDSAGHLLVGTTDTTPWDNAADSTADNGIAIREGGLLAATRYQSNPLALNRTGNDGTIVDFRRTGTIKGTIGVTTTAVSYNTTSDYRLKENVNYEWDATSRLKQLKPARFNFIADPDNTVDGFIAHEAQEVVPESVTGVKDEVDDDDNPVMQGIDQAKLVPLLVKTIQELEARIAVLEAK